MNHFSLRFSTLVLVGLALSHADWQSTIAAQDKRPPAHEFFENDKCLDCHRNAIARSRFLEDATAGVWEHTDKHREGFKLLVSQPELVRRILGFELAEAFETPELRKLKSGELPPETLARVTTVRQCLNCHATWPQDHDPHQPPVRLELGVSCQACHGPGDAWADAHSYAWWRLVTPAAKETLGFRDLRNPITRAKVCASCHVGNLQEGKFIPHDWYAAGHPPLPSFEYSTFAAAMPVHWRPLNEKLAFEGKEANDPALDRGELDRNKLRKKNIDIPEAEVKASYREANFPREQFGDHDPFADLPRLKDSLIAGVVVEQMYSQVLHDYAKQMLLSAAGSGSRPTWPEFSLYECASCHHELRSGPGFPQRPFARGPIGRPGAQVWPRAASELAILQANDHKADLAADPLVRLRTAETNLDRALTTTVFGRPAEVEKSAAELAAELETILVKLRVSRFDRAASHNALLHLTTAKQMEIRDYHSARQLAWIIREVSKDQANIPYRKFAEHPQYTAIEQLFDLPPRENEPPQDVLALNLPATQKQRIVENQNVSLSAIRNYDAARFSQQLEELNRRFREQGPPLLPLEGPGTK